MKHIIAGVYGYGCQTGNRRTFISELAENGATGMRIFGHLAWEAQQKIFTPFARVMKLERIYEFHFNPPLPGEEYRRDRYYQTDRGVVFRHRAYPGPDIPVYDLGFFDSQYFEIIEELFSLCKEFGLAIWPFELDDNCSDKGNGLVKYWSPYISSPQAHGSSTPGGLFGDEIKKYMKGYWDKILALALQTRVRIAWSIRNEYDYRASVVDEDQAIAWYQDSVNFIKAHDPNAVFIPSSMIYPGSLIFPSPKVFFHMCGSYGLHGCINQSNYERERGNCTIEKFDIELHRDMVYLSGDGGSDGTGLPDFRGRRGISLVEVPWIADKVNEGFAGYEALIRYQGGHAVGDLADFQNKYQGMDIIRELAKRINNWTEPVVPPPVVPLEPPTPPEPEPVPIPVKRLWWYWWFGKNSLWAKFWRWIT